MKGLSLCVWLEGKWAVCLQLDGACGVRDKVPATTGLLGPNTCQASCVSGARRSGAHLAISHTAPRTSKGEVRLLVGAERGQAANFAQRSLSVSVSSQDY